MDSRPIACALSPEELRERRDGLLADVLGRARERVSVEDGLVFRFDPRAGLLAALAELMERERQCCPFLRFRLVVEPEGGDVELALTGPAGTRAFLESLVPK